MIQIQNLEKSYGETRALKGVSFSIPRGEVVGLLGPNGAGKTTAMKIVVGYLLPTAGKVRVAGFDVTSDPREVQRRVGYLPENAPAYGEMLVQEYLSFVADMHGLDGPGRRRRLIEAVEECSLGDVLTRPVGHLSKGYRQRVGLAAAILHDPEILVLDEPTSGLDPNQIVEVRRLIGRMGRTKTVILSTHILPEVEATCGRAVILIDGKVRADGTLGDLTRSRVLVATLDPGDPVGARERFRMIPGVRSVDVDSGNDTFRTFRLELENADDDGAVAVAVSEAVRENRWPLRELRRDDRSLEQVFRELTESSEEVTA